ncbi:hypothetical protein AAVH_28018 [Aphelenchoides avenae]|nr:hypothetical protein AAVH_28018 [Aphelenchus avenae]
MKYNSTHYCAIYDVCMKSLYSRDSSRWIVQAELIDFKTARDLASKRAVHSTLPSSKHMPSQHQAISELRDRLAKEATHMKGLLATVREGAKGSNADRTNKLMEKALHGMSTLIAQLANEAERTNINLQVELLATRQRFREDALANCNAELEKKSHQALVMEAKIRDLNV